MSLLHLYSQFSALAKSCYCTQWEYPWVTSPNLAMRRIVLESWKQNPQLDLSVSSEINNMKTLLTVKCQDYLKVAVLVYVQKGTSVCVNTRHLFDSFLYV